MAVTRAAYVTRWDDPDYRVIVRLMARAIRSDGCSGPAIEAYQDGCYEHDIHYALHRDLRTGEPLVQEDADLMFRWYIQHHSWFGDWSPMAWWRYKMLSREGLNFGRVPWATGPQRLLDRLALEPMPEIKRGTADPPEELQTP